jgi:hypothetical protein
MKILSFVIVTSAFICQSAWAQEMSIERSALGELSAQTQVIESVSSYTGSDVLAEVAVLPRQSYVFSSPINVQQVHYLKGLGDTVKENEAFAVIKGPEVHHFYMTYKAKKVLFKQAQALFNNSKKLYQRKSLSEQAWLDISKQYQDIKMEHDELMHFIDFVRSFDEKNDALTLGSPVAGIIQYNTSNSLTVNGVIASFAPSQAVRLMVKLPINAKQKPLYVESGNCKVDIDFTENANSAFYRTAWTKAPEANCTYPIGQVLSVSPQYQLNAYKVKQSSVFNSNGDNYIFIQNKENFEAVKVTLITSEGNNYIFESEALLANKIALVSSVSAAHGILQGLGL